MNIYADAYYSINPKRPAVESSRKKSSVPFCNYLINVTIIVESKSLR